MIKSFRLNLQQLIFLAITINFFGLLSVDVKEAQANPQRCYQEALPSFYNTYTANLVAWMCQGATSTLPAQCFKSALPSFYNDQVAKRAAMVCKGATSIAPGKCFAEALGSFYNSETVERAFTLCQTNSSSSAINQRSGEIYGAWGVKIGRWSGLLRMNGNYGTLVLVSNNAEVVEQRMTLRTNSKDGYILEGKLVTWQNLASNYSPDNFYIENFYKKISAKSCDSNRVCNTAILTYLSK